MKTIKKYLITLTAFLILGFGHVQATEMEEGPTAYHQVFTSVLPNMEAPFDDKHPFYIMVSDDLPDSTFRVNFNYIHAPNDTENDLNQKYGPNVISFTELESSAEIFQYIFLTYIWAQYFDEPTDDLLSMTKRLSTYNTLGIDKESIKANPSAKKHLQQLTDIREQLLTTEKTLSVRAQDLFSKLSEDSFTGSFNITIPHAGVLAVEFQNLLHAENAGTINSPIDKLQVDNSYTNAGVKEGVKDSARCEEIEKASQSPKKRKHFEFPGRPKVTNIENLMNSLNSKFGTFLESELRHRVMKTQKSGGSGMYH